MSEKLGIPLIGSNPDTAHWGTKIGSHEIFEEAQIPHPAHTPLCQSVDELADKILCLLSKYPDTEALVVKLNESFTGEGNAILDITNVFSKMEIEQLKGMTIGCYQ